MTTTTKRIRIQRSLLALTALAGVLAPMIPALAAPPPNVFQDADGNVYIHGSLAAGLASNATAQTSGFLTRNVRPGYCGEIRLATSASLPSIGDSWTIGGTNRLRSNLVSITSDSLLPSCRNAAWTPTLTAAITAAGGFVDNTPGGNGRVVLLGFASGVSTPVEFADIPQSMSLRRNQCGFVRISNSASNPAPASLTIGGTTYNTTTATIATAPLCRETGNGTYETFTPSSWN